MTTEYRFYQLGRSTLSQALGGILPKAIERGMRAYILCASTERMTDLNNRLWSDDPGSFLPHGMATEQGAEAQPVLLDTADTLPANGAKLLILTDGAASAHNDNYEMICVMLDSGDEAALKSSRDMWKSITAAGHKASYWEQKPSGGWVEKNVKQ